MTTGSGRNGFDLDEITSSVSRQDAQLSQRDRAAGCVIVFAKRIEDWNWETIFTDIIGLSLTTVI